MRTEIPLEPSITHCLYYGYVELLVLTILSYPIHIQQRNQDFRENLDEEYVLLLLLL